MSDIEKTTEQAPAERNDSAAEPRPATAPVEHDDSAQKEARATLAAISAAMAERSQQPLIRKETPDAASDQITEDDRQLDGTSSEQLPLTVSASESKPEKQKLGRTRPEKPVRPERSGWKWAVLGEVVKRGRAEAKSSQQPSDDSGEQSDQDSGDEAVGAMPAKSGKSSRRIVLIVAAASIVSGGIGLILGLSANQSVLDAIIPPPSTAIGEGRSVAASSGKDFVGDIVARAMPAVVSIDTAPRELNPANGNSSNFSFGASIPSSAHLPPPFKRSLGTGVIVRSDGYIVTSAHVVRRQPGRLFATLNDSRSLEAKVIGKDPFTDIALLKVDARNLAAAHFAPKGATRPGDWAIAIGTPFGFDHSVSLGIVSAIGRSISDLNNHVDLIQTDAAMNPGNSGGPLLNSRGEVIGINSVVRSNAQNIGFAIPADVVRESAKAIMASGDVKRPFVGIFMADIDPYTLTKGDIEHGALIVRVVPGSPCEKAGLGKGDVIVRLNGLSVRNTKDVRELLKQSKPDDTMEFVVFRKGSGVETRKVKIGAYAYE